MNRLLKMPRLGWVALVGAVLFVVLIVLTQPSASPGLNESGGPLVQGVRERRARTVERGGSTLQAPRFPVALTHYGRLSGRDIFRPLIVTRGVVANSSRRLPPAAVEPLPSVPMAPLASDVVVQVTFGPWMCVGYASENGHPMATIENKTDHKGSIVRIGDQIDGSPVIGVSSAGVRLIKRGKPVLLALSNGADVVKKAASKPPPATAPGPRAASAPPAPQAMARPGPSSSLPAPMPGPQPAELVKEGGLKVQAAMPAEKLSLEMRH